MCVGQGKPHFRHCSRNCIFSPMLVYIQIPAYLRQWVLHDFGDNEGVVRFPRGSAENDVLEYTITCQPKDEPPQLRQEGDLAIEVPDFKSKPQPYYCYINKKAKEMLAHIIYVRFRMQLWQDLNSIERLQCPITDMIYEWMDRHGIDDDPKNWETIRQIFFRQRKQYRKKNEEKR